MSTNNLCFEAKYERDIQHNTSHIPYFGLHLNHILRLVRSKLLGDGNVPGLLSSCSQEVSNK